ncbi:MAG: LPS-assembly protein LptD, partial [Pelagibacteraceae bacterium]|nr:LPS-assembly protein LptD [Pelagibacteraceae bacterium]
MKNNKNIFLYLILIFFSLIQGLVADEFDISASNIKLLQDSETIQAKGNVLIVGQDGIIIESENATYDKKKNIIDAKKSVKITDRKTNDELKSDKIRYSKNKEEVLAEGNVFFKGSEGVTIETEIALYDKRNQVIKSDQSTKMNDGYGNSIFLDMFNYSTKNKNLRSQGNIKIIDKYENKYFFNDIFVDIKNKRMAGSNLKLKFKKDTFGNIENDPRLVANSAVITENKSYIEGGVFTTCKKKGDKCPPWKLVAEKIIHDKEKQKISYENAKLYLYGYPVFYIPKFFHPDPTVKRQSGFLTPSITNSTLLGNGINLPYYFALAEHKDATLNPKIYADENPVIQTEYRYVTKNSYSILDGSFNQGYKKTSNKKTDGSRNHIFARSDIDLDLETFDESKLSINFQKTSNDTYLKVHDINSKIMGSNTMMNSSIAMNFSKNNSDLDISMDVYEDLSKTEERYEFVAPNYDYRNKLSISEELGTLNFQSRGYYKNYETNKKQTKLVNDFHWKSNDYINNSGIITKFEGNLKNSNYRSENTSDHKNEKNNIEFMGAVSLLSSLPLEKRSENYKKTLTPKLMLRTAPGHMRNMSNDSLKLGMSNLYSLNKLSAIGTIETGTSLTLGTDYNYKDKNDFEKFNLSVGQVFSYDDNADMPRKSTLNEKTSELVGNINYYLNEFSKVGYKFSLDNNYSTLNYNEISGIFKINKLVTNFEYLEENN